MTPTRWFRATRTITPMLVAACAITLSRADADPRRDAPIDSTSLAPPLAPPAPASPASPGRVLPGPPRTIELTPGRPVGLDLEPFTILDPYAPMIIAGAEGEFETVPPDLALYRGTLAGDPDSSVFIAASARGVRGVIRSGHQTHFLTLDEAGAPRLTPASALHTDELPPDLCAVNAAGSDFRAGWPEPRRAGNGSATQGKAERDCRVADIAIDSDFEFTQRFGVDGPAAAAEYALVLLGAVSEIYRRDLNVRLNVTYLRVWADAADPWDNSATLYNQFSAYWNAHMGAVPRHSALMLSGRLDQLFAGEASVASLCDTQDAYAVATKLNGGFPYPIQNQSPANWDLFVTAHELGHNFGTLHTHEYDPPIDSCGLGDCASANTGTIMSYCHLCPAPGSGGINSVANINLNFHPRVAETILDFLDTIPCDLAIQGQSAIDDHAFAVESLPVIIDVLRNDQALSCGTVTINAFDATSANGARIDLIPARNFGRERLQYTPKIGSGTRDSFSYSVADGPGSATVTIDIEPLRAPDPTGAILPGIDTAYFVLPDVSALPNYSAMTPYEQEIVAQLNYPASVAPFAGSGRASFVGARFDAFIIAPAPGIYTLYLASDDGSRLTLGDEVLIDNDGVHTMIERSAAVGLSAGAHRVRIDFFERTRSAGLIVSWQGPGIAKQVIGPANWFQSVPCPGDRNLDAAVNIDDLNIVLSQWALTVPARTGGDENGDGIVNINDLNIILANWANTCP